MSRLDSVRMLRWLRVLAQPTQTGARGMFFRINGYSVFRRPTSPYGRAVVSYSLLRGYLFKAGCLRLAAVFAHVEPSSGDIPNSVQGLEDDFQVLLQSIATADVRCFSDILVLGQFCSVPSSSSTICPHPTAEFTIALDDAFHGADHRYCLRNYTTSGWSRRASAPGWGHSGERRIPNTDKSDWCV